MHTRSRDNAASDQTVRPRRETRARRRGRVRVLAVALVLALGTVDTSAQAGAQPALQSDFAPVATSWLNASTGYVLGEGACPLPQTGCTSVMMTSDGGRTFSRLPGPRTPLASLDGSTTHAVSRLLFVTPLVGYAWGPGLWLTTDGARHWTLLATTNVIAVLHSENAVDVLALSCPPTATTCESPQLDVWRAPIGHIALSMVTRLEGSGQWEAADNGEIAVITLASVPTAGPSRLWRSSNGGATWSTGHQPCTAGPATEPDAVAVSRDGSILVVCGGPSGAGQQQKVLYASADAGATFVDVGPTPLNGMAQGVAAFGRDTLAVTARSGGDEIYVSVDGGLHYATTTVSGGGTPLTSLAWTGPTSVVVIEGSPGQAGPNRLLMSTDFGARWMTLSFTGVTSASAITSSAIWVGALRAQAPAAAACLERSASSVSMSCLRDYLLTHGAPIGAVTFVMRFHAYLVGWRPGAIPVGDELSLIPMDCGCSQLVLGPPSGTITTPVPHPGGPGWAALGHWYPLPGGGTGLTLAGLTGWVETDPTSGRSLTLQYPIVNRCASCTIPYHLRVLVRLTATGAPQRAVSLGPCLVPGATPSDPNVPRCPPVEAWLT